MSRIVLDCVIEEIIEKEQPYGIILVGSLSRQDELDFKCVRDIDLFVITDKIEFFREVRTIEELEFDISFLPTVLLDDAIDKRLASLISVLAKSKILYKSQENTLKNYLKVIKSIYEEGPQKNKILDEEYERFKLTQQYLTLASRLDDSLNFKFLSGVFLKDLLQSYFRLNNIWMPPDKRILQSISDKKLLKLIEEYLSNTQDNEECLEQIGRILDYVLIPFGGRLDFWEKNQFPFDFL